ncbi:2Fe-2S iron-sulfur cluster-binding protein [Zunongwangia sp. F363]|uniref:2Fe-2S iron-sulfur cluster-binding protein n=1 Tax=Autumnicola tepida TaxID=3075595 RepID=A0ABU3C8M9_9FLAO|nr:2Fe-2S iron-sulfur cluster-binding protein [Zunongwangia sp. F363]MDT0642662.1 2Fe-2S iron-sulfur cluster-binding protein [Zunongwangia sp. F363]
MELSKHPETTSVELNINGRKVELQISAWTTLLDALREHLQLTGTKKGCDHGQCGACTVLVNGKHINSCLTLAAMQTDKEITTIEGLSNGENLHPVQEAFIEHDAFQCGYCTPGQICSTVGMLNMKKGNSPEEIRDLMSGNICRCGAYANIYKVVEEMKEKGTEGTPSI